MDDLAKQIERNLSAVQNRMEASARRAGRDPAEIHLVVVTKAQPPEVLSAAVQAGALIVGENYAEEAQAKQTILGGRLGVAWHMIGHVQSRKARLVVNDFDWVHSLDSVKLAERYHEIATETGRRLPVLLELNIGGEETKFGWAIPGKEALDLLRPDFERILSLPFLQVLGLMTMPPFTDQP